MGILGSTGGAKTATPPTYTCLQIQTSSQCMPIAILWGAQRMTGNVIDYFNFQASGSKKGGGGKGGKGGSQDYTAAVVLALCEGSATDTPNAVGRMWSGTSETTLDGFGGGIFAGTADQAPWSSAAAIGHTVGYSFTMYYANYGLDLGASATLPNINFEVFSTFHAYHVDNANTHLPDANFGDVIPDFLTNDRWGLSLDPALLQGFDEGGLAGSTSLLVYNLAAGIYVSPLLKSQEQVTTTIARWATVANAWIFYNGMVIKCVCLGDSTIAAHGVTYAPSLQPIYDLGPDDFQISPQKNENADPQPPVKVKIKDPTDNFNYIQLNCSIRTTNGGVADSPAYQDTPFRWFDEDSIDRGGVMSPTVISSTEICNVGTAAACVALIGQRTQYIRKEYEFKLLYYFLLLEPGDIVTLTEPNIGLDHFVVRIKTVDEDDAGTLAFSAEEFPFGVGTANLQEFEPQAGMAPFNQLVPPGPVNTPAFLQPDVSLTGGQPEIWIALSGGPECGGCGVFISFDDITYTQLGQVTTPSLQGVLTAVLPEASGLDIANTLAIDLSECDGVIPTTATEADAQAYRTLCMVDEELIAFGSVMPSGAYTANITYLERGLYGTTPAAHAVGAPFARIDQTKVFQYPLPAQYVGQTLYFQFPTVNLFGNAAQSLADCTTYDYAPDLLGAPQDFAISYVYSAGVLQGALCTWMNAPGPAPQQYDFRWSASPSGTMGQSYGTATLISPGATSYLIPASALTGSGDGDAFISMSALSNAAQSPWTADADLPTPTITAAINKYNPDGSYAGLLVQWTQPSPPPAPVSYVLGWNGGAGFVSVPAGAGQYLIPAATIEASDGGGVADLATIQTVYSGGCTSLVSAGFTVTGAPVLPALLTALTATPGASGSGAVLLSWTPGPPARSRLIMP